MQIKTNWIPLFLGNFLGVFNDNFLKYLVVFIGVKWLSKEQAEMVISLASAFLVLPFLFLSPLAGRWAKNYAKKRVFLWAKIAEVPLMLLAAMGFYFSSIYVVLLAVLLMGVQSSLYSPSKYGLIKDVGGVSGIAFGTGYMEMLTFLGVLLGTLSAAAISELASPLYLLMFLLLFIALLGWFVVSRIKVDEIPPESSASDTINPITYFRQSYGVAKHIPTLHLSLVGLGVFWFIAALLQLALTLYCPNVLGLSNIATGMVMTMAAIGIGLGCVVTGWLSNHQVKFSFVYVGGIGIFIAVLLIYIIRPEGYLFSGLVFLTAFFSGFFKVPLNTQVQTVVEGRTLGIILGYQNMIEFSFILLASLVFGLSQWFFPLSFLFLLIALSSLVITVVIWWVMRRDK